MDFTLTEEQELLRDTARSLLADRCPPSLVRAYTDDLSAADPLAKELSGWVGLAEGPLTDLCLVLEETGAVAAPGTFFATTALLVPLLRELDHPLLSQVLAGEVTGTVALASPDGTWVPHGGETKGFVLEADRVDVVAVVDPSQVTVAREVQSSEPVSTIDLSRRFFEVQRGDGETAPTSSEAVARALRTATVALAADLMGTTRWLFDAALEYAKVREQFDRPIGSFQAIKHKLADARLDFERAWAAVYYAAMAIDADDPDAPRAAHVAKATAGQAATRNAKDSIQVHGGIGFTYEHDLHLFLRRAYTSEHLLGTTSWHLDRLADLVIA